MQSDSFVPILDIIKAWNINFPNVIVIIPCKATQNKQLPRRKKWEITVVNLFHLFIDDMLPWGFNNLICAEKQ